MNKNKTLSGDFTKLRQKAEKRINALPHKQIRSYTSSPEDMHRLIHELAIHKIELEIQQDELLQSRGELEESLERYIELYDFSPLGYMTLARDSTILEVNLKAAKMLGVDRPLLKADHFVRFVAAEESSVFNAMLEKVYTSGKPEYCEVLLEHNDAIQRQTLVRLDGVVSNDGQECQITLLELGTARKVARKNELF